MVRIFIVVSVILFSLTARGVTYEQTFTLLPTNDVPEWPPIAGNSVALDGNLALISSYPMCGAYLFDVTTGERLCKLSPSSSVTNFFGGCPVALEGNLAAVGVRGDTENGEGSGSVCLFDATTGDQLLKLLPNDGTAGDSFGDSVALSGNLALVGAFGDDDNGDYSGSAYIFDVTTGEQLLKLLPDDGSAYAEFGAAVALSSNLALIATITNPGKQGVYLFNATTGEQLYKLLSDDIASYDGFGVDIAIDGNLVLIGADGNEDNGIATGSAYIFDATTGEQLHKLLPNDSAAWDSFGRSVALEGNLALVGEPDNGATATIPAVRTCLMRRPANSSANLYSRMEPGMTCLERPPTSKAGSL